MLALVLIGAAITQAIHVHLVLGTFVTGILIARSPARERESRDAIRQIGMAFLVPFFFGYTGIKVDLTTLSSGVAKRDDDMKGPQYLDTAASETNRYAVFEIKGVEAAAPLEPGKEVPAKVSGILTIKGKPVQTVADARVTYIKLTTDQLEKDNQKRWGFTTDNLKVRAKFATTLTNHGIPIPQLLILKLANDLQLETDLTFVKQ